VIEFRILGPLEAARDGEPIALSALRLRATLAILLLNSNRVVSVDELADALYAGEPPVTAVNQVQRQISELRKAFGDAAAIKTRPPGYLLKLSPGQLDLDRFERLTTEGASAEPARATELLTEALSLWRGAPLADLGYESFAQAAVGRLGELRLDALERRIEADLALGRHASVVPELEELVAGEPLRERFVAQLMIALYRSGRQADSLAAYRRARSALVDDLGIEPTAELRELEAAILRQDPVLERKVPPSDSFRAVLAVARTNDALDPLLEIAAPLARLPGRQLILTRIVDSEDEVEAAAELVNARRAEVETPLRTAAFATQDLAADVGRLAETYAVDLVLVGESRGPESGKVPAEIAALFSRATPDVAVLATSRLPGEGGVFVPFGGGKHDWAAAELGAWLGHALGKPITLVGTRADPSRGRRDASRLLADASLAIQQVASVETTPLLAEPSDQGLLEAVAPAGVVVAGISEHWRRQGVGDMRRALLREARQPLLLVHRGLRPGGLAPREAATRFTWSLDAHPQNTSF
jgi:DNA-binding SARP family transcriptional activator